MVKYLTLFEPNFINILYNSKFINRVLLIFQSNSESLTPWPRAMDDTWSKTRSTDTSVRGLRAPTQSFWSLCWYL